MEKIKITALIAILVGLSLSPEKLKAQEILCGKITISGAFALYPLTVKWADEFKKLHPNISIDISAGGAGKGMTDVLNGMVDIGMVSREIYPEEVKKDAYYFAVAKDAVVPVVNANNPIINDLLAQGLKAEFGKRIWITGEIKNWNQAFTTNVKLPIHIYTRSDACGAAEIWAKYFGKKQEDLSGSGVYSDPGLALAVKKDKLGIGFNNIGYAYDYRTKKQVSGIKVLPLDLNNNGKVDDDENFYDTMDKLIAAIAAGKYPSPPARELYFVTKSQPQKKIVVEFIRWLLTDGQKYVLETGYINLPKEKTSAEVKKL